MDSGSGFGLWIRDLGSGSELGFWDSPLDCGPGGGGASDPKQAQARDLSLGLFILGSGVHLWTVGSAAAAVTVHPRRDFGLSNHNQGKNPYSKQLFGELH